MIIYIVNKKKKKKTKAAILQGSAFFTVQLVHPYMTTGKTVALTRWTFLASSVSAFEYTV